MKREQFDEMQKQHRERIGNQSFFLLVTLLLIDIAADSFGLRWLDHSTRIFLIVLVCSGVYSLRVILKGAFQAPGVSSSSPWLRVGSAVAVAVIAALVLVKFLKPDEGTTTEDNGSLVLLIVSGGMLLASVLAAWIKKKKDDTKED